MSASLTGEPPSLVQLFSAVWNVRCGERAGFAHRGLEVAAQRRSVRSAQVPATVSPSIRTVGALVP